MANVPQKIEFAIKQHQAGNLPLAEQLYREILQVNPEQIDALHLLGLIHYKKGAYRIAIEHIRRALANSPKNPTFLTNLGVVYSDVGELQNAEASWRLALQADPANEKACARLGLVCQELGQPDAAIEYCQRAIQLNADASNYNNLGSVLLKQGNLEEAVQCFRRSLEIAPDYFQVYKNLGFALKDQRKLAEALDCYQRALQINPDYADAHMERGILLLLQGEFAEGWPEYEWRWRVDRDNLRPRGFTQAKWDGRPLQGRTILVHGEQGLGATLQFVRYVQLLKEHDCRVIFECQTPLFSLLSQGPHVDRLIPFGAQLPSFDVYAPLMSLPGILGTNMENIPAEIPYLFARKDLVGRWNEKLSEIKGFKIGINWQGNPNFIGEPFRSFSVQQFAPLADVPGVQLISLQKGPGADQIAEVPFPLQTLGNDFDEATGAFVDTAAVMKNLDLIVTSDTSVAHLAGGLGVPVWVALPFVPDWRWLLDREDCPWYPNMRLFRQSSPGDWTEVFRRIKAELMKRLSSSDTATQIVVAEDASSVLSVSVEIAPGELIDKITILEIKTERITDPDKLKNVRLELDSLNSARNGAISSSEKLSELTAQLKRVNEALWEIEDDIRDCERHQDFSQRFIELARSVYFSNDERSAIKRQINMLLGSQLVEEKSYAEYRSPNNQPMGEH